MQKLSAATIVDEEVLDNMIKELGNALLESDVNIKLIVQLRKNIRCAPCSRKQTKKQHFSHPTFPALRLTLRRWPRA